MKTGKITINDNGVVINHINGNIWLTQHEIADLFGYGVFVSAVGSNIRSILKSGFLRESEVCKTIPTSSSGSVEVYNLEMIIALAFLIKSKNTEIFRTWLIRRVFSSNANTTIILQMNNLQMLN